MASTLPTAPRILFSIIEPISLVGGFVGAVLDPAWFIAEQIPQSEPIAVHANSQLVALQLGNLYLLMAFMGLAILNTTSENRVVRGYLVALWLGDIGHVAISCWGLGWDKLMSPNEWNAMAGGNIFFTIFLFSMRSAYFLGLFGPDKPVTPALKKTS